MAEFPETRYMRDISLGPATDGMETVAEGISRAIGELVRYLYPRTGGYEVVLREPPAKELGLSVRTAGWRTEITCMGGKNIRYVHGEEKRYFSYSIAAESVIPAVERAEKLGKELAGWLKLICAGGLCVLLFFVLQLIMRELQITSMRVPIVLFGGAIALGGAIGTAIGELIGGVIAAMTTARAYRQPSVQNALAAWDTLHEGLERIMDSAETAAEAREESRVS